MKIRDRTVYQLKAIDLATRYTWREIYEEKTPCTLRACGRKNATKFLKHILNTTTFKIQAVKTDNGTEFTYSYLDTDKESQFDLFCRKHKIERRFIPVATPCFNGVVERVMH